MIPRLLYRVHAEVVTVDSFDLADTAAYDLAFRSFVLEARRELDREAVRRVNEEKRKANAADPSRSWAPGGDRDV